MPWTKTQKQIAARACKAAGIAEEQRRDVVLRNFAHARLPDGTITSTAPRLTNRDFEQFMAVVEGFAGGQVLHFTRGYWQRHAADQWARMRHRAAAIAGELEAAGRLAPGGTGLAGWIEKRVTHGQTNRIEQLDYHGLLALILGLTAYARQNGVELPPAKGDDDTTERQPEGARTPHAITNR